jgi:DNA phosphorothioation-dependent restriction protein DptH
VTGKSGSGKTHFMTEYIVSLQRAGQKVVILDTSDSFTKSAILKNLSVCGGSQALSAAKNYVEQHFTFHQIENDGIPVEILALDYPSAAITKRKIIYSILTANIANVGKKQRAELNRCIEQLLSSSQPSVVGFGDVLESEDVSDSISMQFEDILAPFIEYKQNEDTWGDFLQKTNDIVVISSAAISGSGGSAMVDMLLMSLFYYQRNHPEMHLAVVIDEIQNQNCGGSSPIAQVLKEGRKYHMSLTYATQSLSDKNKDTMKTMNNADMRIYMKPDETSARSIARALDITTSELTQMQKGECYVNGTIYNNLMQSNESGLIHGYTYRHFITE